MPIRPLPDDPSLEHLRKEAKRLRNAIRNGEVSMLAQVREFHPRTGIALADFSLSDAQLVTARSYGFASWTKLKQHVAVVEQFAWDPPPFATRSTSAADTFVRLACMDYGAWHRSNPEKAQRLLDDDPELPRKDIYSAAAAGEVAVVKSMLDREAGLVNQRGGVLRWEPLLYACYSRLEPAANRSTLEVVRLLLSRGADPNAGFLWGGRYVFTALTGAFGRGEDWQNQPPHPDCNAVATLLLKAGADPNDPQTLYNRHFQPDDGHLVLLFEHGLGRYADGPWFKRLGDSIDAPSKMLVQELCWAAAHNFPNRVTLLVEHGVDVNTPSGRTGRTPYQEAVREGHQAIADYLLQHGAKKADLDPLEAFAVACLAERHDEVRERLARDPALLEKLGHDGCIDLLHRAVNARKPDAVRLIAGLGVDVNGMVSGGGLDRSALHNAAGWSGLEMVKLLIDLGADPRLRDLAYHSTPIGWAAYGDKQDVVSYLLQFADIFDAVRVGGVERVAELIRQNPSLVNATDTDGDSIVFYLHPEMRRLEEMLTLLTNHGVDVNARGHAGRTVLDRALARGWKDFADLLRAHGATSSALESD
jgi:ankyrin repeat protein